MAVVLWAWLRRRAHYRYRPTWWYLLWAGVLLGLALSALARTWWAAGFFGLALFGWWVVR